MSSTLLKGVPCSLATSRSKSALLGNGRPRMLVMLGAVEDDELGGATGRARRRVQRATLFRDRPA